jgi:hypothetical protein
MSEFDALISSAADALVQLRRLEQHKKLSAEAFCETARDIAGATEARVVELLGKVDSKPAVASFCRRVLAFVAEPTCPCLPLGHKLDRLIRLSSGGHESFDRELASLKATAEELVAVAVLMAATRHPDRFGTVSSWREHQIETEKVRNRLHDLVAQIKVGFSAADLIHQQPTVPLPEPARIDHGDNQAHDAYYRERYARERAARSALPGPWFARCPSVSVNDPRWPERLIEATLTGAATEEQLRERANRRASAAIAQNEDRKGKRGEIERRPIPQPTGLEGFAR